MSESEEESTGSVPGHPDGALQLRQGPHLVLPPFWGDNVAAWFASAESRFRMKRIYDEWDRYDIVVSALSKDDIRLVLDLVTAPPDDDPYTSLKARLLSTHVKTDYQRIEEMLAMDALGSMKPSQLLAHMLELCPADEERTKFFAYHFLHRLPQELRIMLSEDDHQEVHQLARKADRLWAIHGHRLHGAVAAVGLWPVQTVSTPSEVRKFRRGALSSVGVGVAALTSRPSRDRLPVLRLPPWREILLASASSIGILEIKPTSVRPPVRGRETSRPGVA